MRVLSAAVVLTLSCGWGFASDSEVTIVRLHKPSAEADGRFELLREKVAQAAPGVDVRWFAEATRLQFPEDAVDAILFVQNGGGRVALDGEGASFGRGDVILLRAGGELVFEPPAGVLMFTQPEPLPEALPWILRPDSDADIADTPGGCATAYDAYRRIVLTWDEANGPYVHRGLNAHRVNVTDSFAHYHPEAGGFDELYLVQGAGPKAGLWVGEELAPFLDPEGVPKESLESFLRWIPLRTGDLVHIPRGVVHRGVGGVLAHVIALPGFVPGGEVAVDDAIRRIAERLKPTHSFARPWHGGPAWIALQATSSGVDVAIDGRPFTSYRSEDDPCFFPVLNARGEPVTRAFPFELLAGESQDHPHHRSLWFAHGSLGGADFWHDGPETVRTTALESLRSGLGRGSFESRSAWIDAEGGEVASDRRRLEFFAHDDAWGLDFDLTLVAGEQGLVIGDTKEGSFALRVAPGLKVDRDVAPGALVDSEGRSGADVWGQRAKWILASGELAGGPAAVALFDHPSNLRHPTTWHARTYGLLAANPFGLSDFEGAPKGSGDLSLGPNGDLRLRYRVVVFTEVPDRGRLDDLFSEFARR